MKKWLPLISTLLWIVLLVLLLPRRGLELIEKWGEDKKYQVGQDYANSQYVKGEAGQDISDGQLYLYAGLTYAQGQDPSTVNFEHPPLGKYIWGISWGLLGNPLSLNLPIIFLVLFLFFCLGRHLQIAPWLLVVGQGLLALVLQPHCLTHTLLDYQLMVWTLLFFWLIFWEQETWQKYILLGLVMGGLAATKYPLPNILPYGLILGWLVYTRRSWKLLPLALVTASLVYLASYSFYFLAEHSLMDWLRFEKYRLDWWTGDRPLRAHLIWQVLLCGGFPAWWESGAQNWHTDHDWNLVLPLLFGASAVIGARMTYRFFAKKPTFQNPAIVILWVFSLLMMGIYTFGSAEAIRYLWIVIPLWYLVIAGWLSSICKRTSVANNR